MSDVYLDFLNLFWFLISNIDFCVLLGLLEKNICFSIFVTITLKTINIFGGFKSLLLGDMLNSIKKRFIKNTKRLFERKFYSISSSKKLTYKKLLF